MTPQEKEAIKKIITDFSRIKKKKNLTSQDETKLVKAISGLLGLFAVHPRSKPLEKQITAMFDFAKKQLWAVEGSLVEFKRIKRRLLRVKRVK